MSTTMRPDPSCSGQMPRASDCYNPEHEPLDGDFQTHKGTPCQLTSEHSQQKLQGGSPNTWPTTLICPLAKPPSKNTSTALSAGTTSGCTIDKALPVLTGEIKMPDSGQGRHPLNADLVNDALEKAFLAGVQYCLTWNVRQFVLFSIAITCADAVPTWPDNRHLMRDASGL